VEHPIDHQPVIIPPVPLPRMSRQQPLQPRPFLIGQVMTPKPVIIHDRHPNRSSRNDLQDTP
jgi:hypothetical protein